MEVSVGQDIRNKCAFWPVINPKPEENDTFSLSFDFSFTSFALVYHVQSCFLFSPLWSVLHLPDEKVMFRGECNEYVL